MLSLTTHSYSVEVEMLPGEDRVGVWDANNGLVFDLILFVLLVIAVSRRVKCPFCWSLFVFYFKGCLPGFRIGPPPPQPPNPQPLQHPLLTSPQRHLMGNRDVLIAARLHNGDMRASAVRGRVRVCECTYIYIHVCVCVCMRVIVCLCMSVRVRLAPVIAVVFAHLCLTLPLYRFYRAFS
jgi:hypothetical protein